MPTARSSLLHNEFAGRNRSGPWAIAGHEFVCDPLEVKFSIGSSFLESCVLAPKQNCG